MPASKDPLPAGTLETARAWVRQELELRHLPALPDDLATHLFLQGRSAWTFRYGPLSVETSGDTWKLQFKVCAILKKEWHAELKASRHPYAVTLWLRRDDDDLENLIIREDTGEG